MYIYISYISTLKLVLMITFHKNSAGRIANLNVLSHLCSPPHLCGACAVWKIVTLGPVAYFQGLYKAM